MARDREPCGKTGDAIPSDSAVAIRSEARVLRFLSPPDALPVQRDRAATNLTVSNSYSPHIARELVAGRQNRRVAASRLTSPGKAPVSVRPDVPPPDFTQITCQRDRPNQGRWSIANSRRAIYLDNRTGAASMNVVCLALSSPKDSLRRTQRARRNIICWGEGPSQPDRLKKRLETLKNRVSKSEPLDFRRKSFWFPSLRALGVLCGD